MDSSTSKVTVGDEKTSGYTISLDKIDLSLIPIFNHQRRDTKVPLWSPAASGPGAEYYELQVLAEEGSSKDERLENASTHMCHVCNVDVCISYWQRHTTSAVHQANKAIAQTSLCRMQQMALSTAVAPPAPRTTTYFCHPCSSAVAISKRTAHKHSEQHSSAVLYEQLLQSLARLYESKDNLVIVCEDVSRAICDHATISKDLKSRLLDKKLHKKEENKDNEINNKSETDADHIKPTESNVTKTQAQLVKTDQSQIGYPIGTTIKPMPKLMLQKPTKKLHYLFSRTKDLGPEVMCLVCQTNLSLCDVMSHRKSKTHQEVYIDFLTTNTIFRIPGRRYFCNCCRQTIHVRIEYAHIISERHRCNLNRNTERLGQAALMKLSIATLNEKSGDEQRMIDTDDTFWSVHSSDSTTTFDQENENKDSDEENSIFESDASSESAKTHDPDGNGDVKKSNKENDIPTDFIPRNLTEAEGKLPDNKVKLHVRNGYCHVCSMKIPNKGSNINDHVKGKNHKANLKILVSHPVQNKSANVDNYVRKGRCSLCNMKIPNNVTNIEAHINGKTHKQMLICKQQKKSNSRKN